MIFSRAFSDDGKFHRRFHGTKLCMARLLYVIVCMSVRKPMRRVNLIKQNSIKTRVYHG